MARKKITSEYFINLDKEYVKRFDLGKFLNYDLDSFEVLNSSILNELKELKNGGVYTVQGEESRPDLISYRTYGDSQYWWIILLYNELTSINDIVHGSKLNLPSLSAMEDFYFSLKTKQSDSDRDV